jgi:hypothetical protein
MKRIPLIAVLVGLSSLGSRAAADEPTDTSPARETPALHRATLELGFGAPWGATVGVGVRHERVQVAAEVGEIGAPFIFGFSSVLSLRGDLSAPSRRTVYLGASVSRSWFLAGSDETAEWQLTAVGPMAGIRWRLRRRISAAVEAGALYGTCDGDCMSFGGTAYFGLQLGAKLSIGLF